MQTVQTLSRSILQQIGLVPQDPLLSIGTIENVIRFGNPGAIFGDVVDAAKLANDHEFVHDLLQEYQTPRLEGE